MKTLFLTTLIVAALSVVSHSQNLRFWTQNRVIDNRCVVNIYACNIKTGAPELLQGVNLRYYYQSDQLQYESFMLSSPLLAAGFHTFGGQGNNEFAPGDVTQHGTADRFVAHAPFALDGGKQLKPGEKTLIASITFVMLSNSSPSVINAYLVGTNIFRALTYTGSPACQDGCPLIVTAPHTAIPRPHEIDLLAKKYGPNHGHLTWRMTSPDDVQQYLVERMIDDGKWDRLAALQADGQHVNIYVDEKVYENLLPHQTISYRVRAIQESDEIMSDIKQIHFTSQKMIIELYPNPASDKVQVTMTETGTEEPSYLEIYSYDGKLAYRNVLQHGVAKEQIDLAAVNIQSGSYTVHLTSGGEILDVRPLHIMR